MMKRLVNGLAIVSIGFLWCIPGVVSAADIEIREVMYNLDGTDADREWIEIRNVSDSDIDLNDWHFREGGTDHRLNPVSDGGSTTLSSGAYAVIADDPSSFNADNPDFSALLLDSSFSLSNDGETLSITDPEKSVVTSLSYDPADGGDGDGLSLQRHNGQWISAEPTPGRANATTDASGNDTEADDSDTQTSGGGGAAMRVMEPRTSAASNDSNSDQAISIEAGSDINALAGAQVHLVGQISGASEDHPALEARWSFGNADVKEGSDIFYTYEHPGEYVATFSVTYDGDTYTDPITVDVVSPDISIDEVTTGPDGYIALDNQVGRNVDLSGWHLRAGGDNFTLPKNTILLRGETLAISHETTGLSGGSAELLFPNGEIATTSQPEDSTSRESSDSYRQYERPAGNTVEPTNTASPDQPATSSATSLSLSEAFSTTSQAAAAGVAGQSSVFWQWAAMLILLVVSSIGAVIIIGRFSKPADDPAVQAARFDINEM